MSAIVNVYEDKNKGSKKENKSSKDLFTWNRSKMCLFQGGNQMQK